MCLSHTQLNFSGGGRGCAHAAALSIVMNWMRCKQIPPVSLSPQLGAVALYYTYTAMEEEIERNKDHPSFAPLYFPNELHRHEALAQDLEYFYGEDWQNQISCSSAAQHYVDRIHEVGQTDPVLLVAHAYTRYMGDLSGGQVLKKVAQRALRLPPTGEGVKFYEFDSIHSAKAFKQLYRSRMNELELDAQTKEKLVQEAVLAFQFNMEVRGAKEETSVNALIMLSTYI
uniref:heme oxygenase (biliverdin-producing) n=1 Tax=Astyanax mexicanus TaxID=7994 RepID=A0A8B9KFX1_ASTMX